MSMSPLIAEDLDGLHRLHGGPCVSGGVTWAAKTWPLMCLCIYIYIHSANFGKGACCEQKALFAVRSISGGNKLLQNLSCIDVCRAPVPPAGCSHGQGLCLICLVHRTKAHRNDDMGIQ